MSRYLQNKKVFQKYRVVAEYDTSTNDFPRDDNGNIDKSFEDIYILCANNCRISHYGRNILEAYIPSVIRGKNIIKKINLINENIVFNITQTDEEMIFQFNVKYLDIVASCMKARLNRRLENGEYNYISPFSKRNLPKSNYEIPYDELEQYTTIINHIPQNKKVYINIINKNFIRKYICKRNMTITDIKKEQRKLMLRTKEYIHYKGMWDLYLKYIEKEITKY